ncbi:MAG: hypothetical protein ACMUIU_16255 [bacterium]
MKKSIINDKLNTLVQEFDFKDITELVKDYLVTEILYKISNFTEEIEHFEEKYGKSLIEFKKEYEKGKEDFEKYDNLMAWEFAQQGKEYWEKKLEEVKNVL